MTGALAADRERLRRHGPREAARHGAGYARGALHRRRFDRCGPGLRAMGGVRVFCGNGRIELGRDVLLWPAVKLAVDGSEAAPALLRIGDGVRIGDRSELHCGTRLMIGDGTILAWDVVVLDRDYHALDDRAETRRPVDIGEEVWIGCRALVLKGVRIGSGAVVAAGSVVSHDVAERALVAGNPARVVRDQVRWSRR